MKRNIILAVILTILSCFTAYIVLTMSPADLKNHASQITTKIKEKRIASKEEVESKVEIKIASQEELLYAPINILNSISNIEELVPNTNISIDRFKNSESVFQALNEDNSSYNIACLDLASMLFYNEKNPLKMKLLFGLTIPQYELFTNNAKRYKNLASIGANDKIAVSSIGSTEHIILAMASKKLAKNAHKLDRNVVAMENSIALEALSKKEITAHFAGGNAILKDEKALGRSLIKSADFIKNVSTICMVDSTFYNNNKAELDNLTLTMNELITLIGNKEESLLKKIAELNNISIEESTPSKLTYSTDILGVEELYKFMLENEYLKNEVDINSIFIYEK